MFDGLVLKQMSNYGKINFAINIFILQKKRVKCMIIQTSYISVQTLCSHWFPLECLLIFTGMLAYILILLMV